MKNIEDVEVKLLQCKQGSIILYAYIREHPSNREQLSKIFGYIDIDTCIEQLYSTDLFITEKDSFMSNKKGVK